MQKVSKQKFETLIKENNVKYADRWKPIELQYHRACLAQGTLCDLNADIRSNISYCLQYLQYLQFQIENLRLHNIIELYIYKSYIISALGIIECLFYYLLKNSNMYKKKEWECNDKAHETTAFVDNGITKKLVITTIEKLPSPVDDQMDFDAMINKVQSKKLLSLDMAAFPCLRSLKKIRNKVHLHIIQSKQDADYNSICKYDFYMTRYILYLILTDKMLGLDKLPASYEFIKLSSDELKELNLFRMSKKTKEAAKP